MVELSPAHSTLMNVETIPPTPPQEPVDGAPQSATPGFFRRLFSSGDKSPQKSNIITPKSSAEASKPISSSSKRVGWSEQYDYKDPPTRISDNKIINAAKLQLLPPSSERKATKSILKANHGPGETPQNTTATHNGNDKNCNDQNPPSKSSKLDLRMLELMTQKLAGQDRSSRLEAYKALSAGFKACEDTSDRKSLALKVNVLLQFIERDISAKNDDGKQDVSLIKDALLLVSSFLYHKTFADKMHADFNNKLVSYALKTFENPAMIKEIVSVLMFIMAQQKFSSKIMTAERVVRLISDLHNIEDYVKGKSIVEQRMNVYRTLLRHSKVQMISELDWLQDLFSDMLSNYANVRSAAITFGIEAATHLGRDSKVSAKVMELFKISDSDNIQYGTYYADILRDMVGRKSPAVVPRIWTVTILFLRNRPRQLEQWAFANPWFNVITRCFNSSDQATRLAANVAWNRMVYVIRPDENTAPNMVGLLSQPLICQFWRREIRKVSESENIYRKSMVSSMCNLLYYSLKPSATPGQIDKYWDEYVIRMIGKDFIGDSRSAHQELIDTCSILQGLFDSRTPRIWDENRALRDPAVVPTELPPLDSRWLRRNASRAFQVLDTLIEPLYWDLSLPGSRMGSLWESYVTSIASAGAKEVKTSDDTMTSMAYLFNTLYKVWQKGPKGLQFRPPHGITGSNYFNNFGFLVVTVISRLGVIPFTERHLSMGQQDQFSVVATPSQRPGKIHGQIRSPLHHLFVLLSTKSPGADYNDRFMDLLKSILTPFFDARRSSKGKMDLVKDLIEILSTIHGETSGAMWTLLADFATGAIDLKDETIAKNTYNDRPLGGEYRNIVRILDIGLVLSPHKPLQGWAPLFDALVTSASTDAGDGGRAIAVIEPIAETLVSQWLPDASASVESVEYCKLLVSRARYPKDKQALDAARRCLWGTSTAGPRIAAFDPYSSLYDFASRCLKICYKLWPASSMTDIPGLLLALEALISICPKTLCIDVLSRLQDGIAVWVSDEEGKVDSGTILSKSVNTLWGKICTLIPSDQKGLPTLLSKLEPLIYSGLSSKRASIANIAIEMWKTTFGTFDGDLEYPETIKEALLRLASITDIPLPSPLGSSDLPTSENHRQPVVFADTQAESCNIAGPNVSNRGAKRSASRTKPSPKQSERVRHVPSRVILPASRSAGRQLSRETTPEPGNRKSRRKSSAVKLRHEDSQIQFEAVAGSSPVSDKVYDSQLLTERQKEVRERQQEVAAMFPDISSSLRPRSVSIAKSSDEELHLPSHQSSSASRLQASLRTDRQATPDTQALEQDNFLNSSPTPARGDVLSLQNASGHPSSPMTTGKVPEPHSFSSANEPTDFPSSHNVSKELIGSQMEAQSDDRRNDKPSSGDFNTTSFPTNLEVDVIAAFATNKSLEPSAQLGSNHLDLNQTFSTYKSTPPQGPDEDADMDTTVELTTTQEQRREIHLQEQRTRKALGLSITGESYANDELELPSTPRRGDHTPVTRQEAVNTQNDIFLDARSSPFSSDRILADDKFEDAISSPQLLAPLRKKQNSTKDQINKASSPLSDHDESSLMRLANEVDSAPREEVVTPFKIPQSPANESKISRTSPRRHPGVSNTSIGSALHNRSKSNTRTIGAPVMQKSSIPSLIPETPAPQPMRKSKHVGLSSSDENGDAESTIVVQVPDSWRSHRPIKSPRGTKRNNKDPAVIEGDYDNKPAKRRKLSDTPQSHSEVPDSQEALHGVRPPMSEVSQSSPTKKRRGRPPKGSSQMSQREGVENGSSSIDPNDSTREIGNVPVITRRRGRSRIGSSQGMAEPTMAQINSMPETTRSLRVARRSSRGPQPASSADDAYENGEIMESTSAPMIMESSFAPIVMASSSPPIVTEPSFAANVNEQPISGVEDNDVINGTMFAGSQAEETVDIGPEDTDLHLVEDNEVINETTSKDSETGNLLDGELDETDLEFVEETLLQSQIAEEMEMLSRTEEMVEVEEKADYTVSPAPSPSYEQCREKLLSLVEDLRKATTFDREQVSDMEDLFMEAKRELYGQHKRGL